MPPSRILGSLLLLLASFGVRASAAQEAAALLPAGARVVVVVRDGAAFWERLRATGLYAALSSLPRVREGLAEHAPLDEAAWLALVGREAAIGVYGETEGGGPDVVVVADVAGADRAREAIAALERLSGGEREIAWEIMGERLVAGTGRARVAAVLDRAAAPGSDPGMGADPAWAEAARRHAGAAVVVWADLEALADAAQAPDDRVFARWIAVGIGWVEGGLRGDAYLALSPDAPAELLAFAAAPPAPVRSTSVFPASSLVALAAMGLDARSLVWGERLGIDVETELAPAFGREVGVAVTGLAPSFLPFPIPSVGAVIEVRDSTRARGVFDRLESWATDALLRGRSIPLAWQGETYQGVTIRYAPTPFGEVVEGAYALTPSFAVFGSSRSAVRALLDAQAGRAPSLAENPGSDALKSFFPPAASGLVYLDLAALAAGLEEVARGLGRLDADREPEAAAIRAAIESAPRLGAYAEPDGENGVWWRAFLEVR